MADPRLACLPYQEATNLQGILVKRMKGFEPSTFAMATRESQPDTIL
jgi:hypothetical protein